MLWCGHMCIVQGMAKGLVRGAAGEGRDGRRQVRCHRLVVLLTWEELVVLRAAAGGKGGVGRWVRGKLGLGAGAGGGT